ncbi:hypothetical protein [Paludisphaera soli]|uniref:hypothetical protein n=1 Tax=Paludisphaera soli TaxID=2712865 RepID=UPI0013ECEC64|nr:hypothetical protein [Paludisphaera soli]
MTTSRRSILSALGAALPFGLGLGASAVAAPTAAAGPAPALRFRPFEDALREAFAGPGAAPCRRVEVGGSEQVRAGLQGCCNDRPFAGFAAGRLRIVRAGFEPGPIRQGVQLYVATVDVALADGPPSAAPGRPIDFASLPPAPTFA